MAQQNQHWVPRFLIKNFADSDGRVFCLNIQTDHVSKASPKRVASAIGFNEFLLNGKTVSFEERLEKIETRAAPALRRIVETRSVLDLSQAHRKWVADFIAAQSFRTEAFYKGLEKGVSRGNFGPIFAQLWRSAFLVSDEVERRKWAVMTIQHDDVFYLGDSPVVLQHTEKPSSTEPLGFDIEGVEAFLPLAPKCALYMPSRSITEQIITGYETAESMHRHFRSAALRGTTPQWISPDPVLQFVQRVLRNSHGIYRALTAGTEVAASPENVENLNYLQCHWAHSAIYANQGDFTFAKRVFRETPQYRKSPRTSLAVARRSA